MYIIIAGAGIVGLHIASVLAEGKHEVTIVENSDEVVEVIRRHLDVKTIIGNASTPKILREAEVNRADLIIAVTNNDETNMLICFLAKELGAAMTVARVRNPDYSGYFVTAAKSPSASRKVVRPKTLGIDLIINPEIAVSDEIIKVLCGLGPTTVSSFADGRIQIAEFKVEQAALINKTLDKIKFPKPCVIAAVTRAGNTFLPEPGETILQGDHLFILATQQAMKEIGSMFTHPQTPVKNVVVLGGKQIGFLVTEGLEKQGISTMVIEEDPGRSEEIAASLNKATVIQGDATDREFLIEQGVPSADAFVSTTDNDELNILCALLAENLGVPRTFIVLSKPGYIPLAEAIGVDFAVSPLLLTAGKIAHFVLHGGAISATFIGGKEVQAVEFAVSSTASIAQRNLTEAGMPKEALTAAIIRGDNIIIPPGDNIIYPGDHIIVIYPLSVTSSVEKIFK